MCARFYMALLACWCFCPLGLAEEISHVAPSRRLEEINWMEFRQVVPGQINTVLLTTGTMEAHGVINNGADNTAPLAMAAAIAETTNALIAPHIPYGVTGGLAPYPGNMHVPAEVYRPYVRSVLEGLAAMGFKNVVILNGHGGPQTPVLNSLAEEVGLARGVNILVTNWWAACSEVTQEVFGVEGGHAAINETAYVQAINPSLVHKELYSQSLAAPNPAPGSSFAFPNPSTIGLYKAGEGYPSDFDQSKAEEYFKKVNACMANLIKDTIRRWQEAELAK